MHKINEKVKKEVKLPHCELCGSESSDLHHIISRGSGGKDHRTNLINLCRACHLQVHQNYNPDKLFEIVANREIMSLEDVKKAVWMMKENKNDCENFNSISRVCKNNYDYCRYCCFEEE